MSNPQIADIGLGHTILRRASLTPNAKALTFEGETWTYAELGDRVRRLATILRDGGVSRGDRVGYIGLNHPSFLEILYACGCLGAVFVFYYHCFSRFSRTMALCAILPNF